MTDAEKLREVADYIEKYPTTGRLSPDLRRIASLLDAVPPETLAAIAAGTWRAVPVEPTEKMFDTDAYPRVRSTRYNLWKTMLSAASAKPKD